MLRYTTAATRILVLAWLATWGLSDPLFLLQELMAPQEHSAGHRFIGNGTVDETHFAPHCSDARVNSSTESNPNRSEEDQSDESGSGNHVDLRRFDRAQSAELTAAFQPWSPFPTSASPRAPPPVSL